LRRDGTGVDEFKTFFPLGMIGVDLHILVIRNCERLLEGQKICDQSSGAMKKARPDWQLPRGVNRGLWDYICSEEIAWNYDEGLRQSSLVQADIEFAHRHFKDKGRLIDLGCGTGRLLVPFAQRGFCVVGVDLSTGMLRAAAERSRAAGVRVNLVQANLTDLGCFAEHSFDYAACLFSTLGMIGPACERKRVLQQVYRLLRRGGTFLLHVHNRWFNVRHAPGRRWLALDAWRVFVNNPHAGDCEMPVHQSIAGLTLHLFTRREVVRSVGDAGFSIQELRPLSLASDSRLKWPRCFGWLRAYGYLVAARRGG
jgi:SAM-dependent methyltransferase